MIKPKRPRVPSESVDAIDPSWFRLLDECLVYAMEYPRADGKTIYKDEGGTLRVPKNQPPPGSGGGSAAGPEPHAVPCKVTGGTSATGYAVNIYGNGVDADPTGTGILHLVEVAHGSNLPIGAWCLGHPYETALTGGN